MSWHVPARYALLLLIGAAGCAARQPCCDFQRHVPSLTPAGHAAHELPAAATEAIPAHAEAVSRVPPPAADRMYHPLSSADAQCLAANHAIVGNLAAIEADLACSDLDSGHRKKRESAALRSTLFTLRANQDRNRAAADALQAYYQLLQAEHAASMLQRSIELMDDTIAAAKQGRAAAIEIDVFELQRNRLAAVASREELEGNRAALSAKLGYLIGRPPYESTPILPTEELAVEFLPIDPEIAVADGLALRPELAAVRLMLDQLGEGSLAEAGMVISQADSLLGMAGGGGSLLAACFQSPCELPARRAQLLTLRASLEQQIAAEVRAAAARLEAGMRKAAADKESVAEWRQRIRELHARQGDGRVTAFDVRAAQLQLHEAESTLIASMVAVKLADAELRRAQGYLAIECGYQLPACCGAAMPLPLANSPMTHADEAPVPPAFLQRLPPPEAASQATWLQPAGSAGDH